MGLHFEGLNFSDRKSLVLTDAAAYAAAAPEATAIMARRLGLACRRDRPLTYAEFGRGLVVVRPRDGKQIAIDSSGRSVPPEQQELLDQFALHLANQSWVHSKILCSVMLIDANNEPCGAFWRAAKVPKSMSYEYKLQRRVIEHKKVREFFDKLQRDYPFEGGDSV